MKEKFDFSVIIPTIGRFSLEKAIQSVVTQEFAVCEIIVVAFHGCLSESRISELAKIQNLKLVWTEVRNISIARNLGIENCSGNWVAFLDDDDLWAKNKLNLQLHYIDNFNVDAVLSSARILSKRIYLRPKKCLDIGDPILINLYRYWFQFRNHRYLPTSSLIYNFRKFPENRFDETLEEREDLWFMHSLQASGATFLQCVEILVDYKGSNPLENRKVSVKQDILWANRLELIEKNLGRKFLMSTAIRNRIYARDFLGAYTLILQVKRF